jgi:crotonobetainyl-CoA:carnitine CoA-transferase CaiB-like acyl-CoA transferase
VTAPGPRLLGDIRVVDLTVARAGPACVRQLADWGAEVIRIDPPTRDRGLGDAGGADFENLHRNKRSIVIDLKSERGRELARELVARADIVVENMRPAVKFRLGVDYATLSEINPRLVYGSISGFGQDGPYSERGAVDQIAQGLGGLMSVTGLPGQGPLRAGIAVADLAAGLHLTVGILVALREREHTGRGQWVRTSLLEAMIAMMDFQAARWTVSGEVPAQEGNHHPTMIPMGCFATADGHVNIAAPSGRLWAAFCAVAALDALPADPRFDSEAKRSANRAQLNEIIAARLALRSTAEWVEELGAAGVPAGAVHAVDEVFADPQTRHLDLVQQHRHPELGEIGLLRNPVSLEGGRPEIRSRSPRPGEHTDAILAELGVASADIDALRDAGVVASL